MILAALLLCTAAQGPVDPIRPADPVDPAEAAPAPPPAPPHRALDVPADHDPLPPPPAPRTIFGDNGSLLDDSALIILGAGATTTMTASMGYALGLLGLLGGSVFSGGNSYLVLAAFVLPPLGAAIGAAVGAFIYSPDLWILVPAAIAALGTTLAYGGVVLLYQNAPVAMGMVGVGVVGGLVGAGAATAAVVMTKRSIAARAPDAE